MGATSQVESSTASDRGRGYFLLPGTWEQRLAFICDMVRELSRQTDPQTMVQAYGRRMRQILPSDVGLSLSRRDLERPRVRVTRSSTWEHTPNPWKERDRLPVFDGGLLSSLIWGDEPVIIPDLREDSRWSADDPAAQYLAGMRSLVAVPLYDRGVAMNMVVVMRREVHAFEADVLPEHVWMANLFGRATQNLVSSEQVKAASAEVRRAYDALDKEMKVVGDIQRSLLPVELPKIDTLDLAAHYQTSKRAGGDYYDFFPLPDGRWGILIADVSGHGTPAAVIMAVTHSIAHAHCGEPSPPSRMLEFLNRRLAARYTNGSGTFVTAFYGIYDPAERRLTFSSAGHCPPRIRGLDGSVAAVDVARGLPLGIDPAERYWDCTAVLKPGEMLVLYTDGITEARDASGEFFGTERLDRVIGGCGGTAGEAAACILADLDAFARGAAAGDDRTLLAMRVS